MWIFDNVEAIEEILPEPPQLRLGAQIPGGGGDHADMDFRELRRADGPHLPFLKHTQQFRLQVEGQLADFVQEKDAAVGGGEKPFPGAIGAGEGALGVAEKLTLDEAGGNGPAVDGDEGAVPPAPRPMQGPRRHFLAGAGLAGHQHREGGIGHLPDKFADLFGRRAVTDESRLLPLPELALEEQVFPLQADAFLRFAKAQKHLVGLEGLGNVVVSPLLEALDGGVDGAVGAHHDHGQLGMLPAHLAQEAKTVAAGHADIAEDGVGGRPGHGEQGFPAVGAASTIR